jgi:hypothetical protein
MQIRDPEWKEFGSGMEKSEPGYTSLIPNTGLAIAFCVCIAEYIEEGRGLCEY